MPAPSSFKKLEAYNLARKLAVECYAYTSELPDLEKSNLSRYIREAAIQCFLTVAQGIFLRRKKKRKKFIRTAQNALVVIDAAIEVIKEVGFADVPSSETIETLSSQLFQLLDRIKKKED